MTEYLYHYTTAEGLIGIVTTCQIWATSILYLNDVEEFRHGMGLGFECAQELRQKGTDPDEKAYLDRLMSTLAELNKVHEAPGFVASFSKHRDDLSQWRAYCRTGGYAIGFRKEDLREIAQERVYLFDKCLYGRPLQRAAVRRFIEDAVELGRASGWTEPSVEALKPLTVYSARLKNDAFDQEKEWRMVRYPGSKSKEQNVKFRARNGVVLPYIECDLTFEKDAARTKAMWKAVRVTVGPCPDKKASKASVEQLLRLRSPAKSPGEVTPTKVPYKYW